jgi:DNA-binding GntR family transcriptional regulator
MTAGRGELSSSVAAAYHAIRGWILDGTLPAREELRESDLAEKIGVRRTPVRSALGLLQAEGLVTYESYRRYTVVALDAEELDKIFELRVELEGLAARKAAQRISADDLEALRQHATAMEEVVDRGGEGLSLRFNDINTAFHVAIVRASGNERLGTMLSHLIDLPLALLSQYQPQLDRHLRRSCRHHREIIEALAAGNPAWAEAQMRAHLLSVRRG